MTPYGQSSSSGYYHGSAYLRDSNQNENQQNQQNFQYFESPNYTTNNLNPYLYHETPKPDYSDSDEDEERVMADRVLHGLPKTIPQPEFRPSLSHSDHSFPHRPNGHLRLDSQAEASKMWHRNGRGRSDTISLTDGLYSIEETSRQMRGIPTAPEGPPPRRPTIENCKLKLNDWEKKRTWWKSGLTIVASFWLVFAALNLFAYIEMYENVKKGKIIAGENAEKIAKDLLAMAIILTCLSVFSFCSGIYGIWRGKRWCIMLFNIQLVITSILYFANLFATCFENESTWASIVISLLIIIYNIFLIVFFSKLSEKLEICEKCY